MKVKELIDMLKKEDQELEVFILNGYDRLEKKYEIYKVQEEGKEVVVLVSY